MPGHDPFTAMATPKRCRTVNALDLSQLTHLDLLHTFTALVCNEHSSKLRDLALEIIRRLTATRTSHVLPSDEHQFVLGSARWGDAKRVYEIFGLKRGPLDRLRRKRKIGSRSLDDTEDENTPSSNRAKRLFDLISIEEFLRSPEGARIALAPKIAPAADGEADSNPVNKPKPKVKMKS